MQIYQKVYRLVSVLLRLINIVRMKVKESWSVMVNNMNNWRQKMQLQSVIYIREDYYRQVNSIKHHVPNIITLVLFDIDMYKISY